MDAAKPYVLANLEQLEAHFQGARTVEAETAADGHFLQDS
jgi:hypothetical protein